jgi:hypothetical protein
MIHFKCSFAPTSITPDSEPTLAPLLDSQSSQPTLQPSFPHPGPSDLVSSDPASIHPPSPLPPIPSILELPPVPLRRSSRFRTQNVRLDDYVLTVSHDDFDVCLVESTSEPVGDNLTYHKARKHAGWCQAMDDEIQSIHKNQTWSLVPLPTGKRAIIAKWVYKTKPSLHGAAPRLKARLVA